VHIPDGILSAPVLAGTGVAALTGVVVGLRRMPYERVPLVGVMSSVFFVTSWLHVPVPPASAHLVLVGLIGLLLGWASFPAIGMALILQAGLGFGGITAIGANLFAMATPAVVCYGVCGPFIRRSRSKAVRAVAAFCAGALGIGLAALLTGGVLYASSADLAGAVLALLIGHLPLMVIEGFVTMAAVAFLLKLRPDVLVPDEIAAKESSRETVC